MKTWFKFYGQEFLADPKMDYLSAPEISIWLTLLCLASMSDEEGTIKYCSEEKIMRKARLNDEEIMKNRNFLKKFKKLKMIEFNYKKGDVIITILNFSKRNNPLTPYERVKNYRERKKIEENLKKIEENLKKIEENSEKIEENEKNQPQMITKSYQNDNNKNRIEKNRKDVEEIKREYERKEEKQFIPPSSGSNLKKNYKEEFWEKVKELKTKSKPKDEFEEILGNPTDQAIKEKTEQIETFFGKKAFLFALLFFLFFSFSRPAQAKTFTVRFKMKTAVRQDKTLIAKKPLSFPSGGGFTSSALSEIPNNEEWAVISKFPNRQLIAHIYKHESSFGRADICRKWGKFNGFGFNEWKGHSPTCFSSFEEVVSLVNNWIEERKYLGLAKMSCLYIRGVAVENCDTNYKFHPSF